MKTRVIKKFDVRNWQWIYFVQKWALWDPPDLRHAYPNDYDWRYVRPYPTAREALDTAKRMADDDCDRVGVAGTDSSHEWEVIDTFGDSGGAEHV